jgi:hypothetical protein
VTGAAGLREGPGRSGWHRTCEGVGRQRDDEDALIGVTGAVALETHAHGITCNAVYPGTARTPSTRRATGALGATDDLSQANAETARDHGSRSRDVERLDLPRCAVHRRHRLRAGEEKVAPLTQSHCRVSLQYTLAEALVRSVNYSCRGRLHCHRAAGAQPARSASAQEVPAAG